MPGVVSVLLYLSDLLLTEKDNSLGGFEGLAQVLWSLNTGEEKEKKLKSSKYTYIIFTCLRVTWKHEFSLFLKPLQCQRNDYEIELRDGLFWSLSRTRALAPGTVLSPVAHLYWVWILRNVYHLSFFLLTNGKCLCVFDQAEAPFHSQIESAFNRF